MMLILSDHLTLARAPWFSDVVHAVPTTEPTDLVCHDTPMICQWSAKGPNGLSARWQPVHAPALA